MHHALIVFLGGGLGSVARYLVALGATRMTTRPVESGDATIAQSPVWGTLAVNVLGCVLIGLVWGRVGITMRDEARLLLITGFLGGFTTFSAIGWESFGLFSRGQVLAGAGYLTGTVVLGLAGVWLGHRIGATMVSG